MIINSTFYPIIEGRIGFIIKRGLKSRRSERVIRYVSPLGIVELRRGNLEPKDLYSFEVLWSVYTLVV